MSFCSYSSFFSSDTIVEEMDLSSNPLPLPSISKYKASLHTPETVSVIFHHNQQNLYENKII